MADEKLKAKLGLDNSEFKRGLKDSEGQLSKMSAGMRRLGVVLGAVFSVSAVTNFAKKSALAYDEEIKASQSLLVALKGRKDIQESLIQQASDLQKKTLFGDEQTIMAASRMAMVIGANEDAIKRLMPLVQDLAQAKFEGNLVTAADMVAKSIGSGTNALSRYGIQIEGAVGSVDRLESAIDGLNRQVGGQAESAAKVGLGSVTILKNAWGDLTEQIGKAIIESQAFNKVIEGLKKAVDALTKDSVPVNDDWALWRGLDKATAEAQKEDVLKEIEYFKSLGDAGKASLWWWQKALEVLDGVINKTESVTSTTVDEVKTIDSLNAQLSEEKALLRQIDIADQKGLTTQLRVIDALEKRIKSLTTIKAVNPMIGGVATLGDLSGSWGKIKGDSKDAWDKMAGGPEAVTAVQDMTDALMLQGEAINILTNGFDALFTSAGDGFKAMIGTMIDGMKRLVAEYLAKAAIFFLIRALFPATAAAEGATKGLAGMGLGKLVGFASGGMVFGPQLAMVGENSSRSNPEVIMPMNKLASMMGGQIIKVDGKIKGKDIALVLRRNG